MRYEIRVQGQLDQQWSAWFDGLTISYDGEGNTILLGPLPDESALHGVLMKVRDLALPLLALRREDMDGSAKAQQGKAYQAQAEKSQEGGGV